MEGPYRQRPASHMEHSSQNEIELELLQDKYCVNGSGRECSNSTLEQFHMGIIRQ